MTFRISPGLEKKFKPSYIENVCDLATQKIAEDTLANVKVYGEGVGNGRTAKGGSPWWQGKVTVQGHYRGYLSDSHSVKKVDKFHKQIVSSAGFVEGVIEGYSTNWAGVRFGMNNYPKRAVDKTYRDGSIPSRVRQSMNEV